MTFGNVHKQTGNALCIFAHDLAASPAGDVCVVLAGADLRKPGEDLKNAVVDCFVLASQEFS